MAPIRRYLRITRHSALEVRIYLDNPVHQETWLLRHNDPALPRIIEAVQPLVLPKLWEEKERAKGKGKGKKSVRDVVAGDDFEVSIFLTENSSPHSLLTKAKTFSDKPRIRSNSGKMTSWLNAGNTSDKPVDVDAVPDVPITIRDEDDDDAPIALDDIPEAAPTTSSDTQGRKSKRRRRENDQEEEEEDTLFVDQSSGSEEESFYPPVKRKRRDQDRDEAEQDDKKKLALNTSYDGFSIYGRILCLVVKRKGGATRAGSNATTQSEALSQQMMENWVSTQAAGNADLENDED